MPFRRWPPARSDPESRSFGQAFPLAPTAASAETCANGVERRIAQGREVALRTQSPALEAGESRIAQGREMAPLSGA